MMTIPIGLFALEVGESDDTGPIERGTWPSYVRQKGEWEEPKTARKAMTADLR